MTAAPMTAAPKPLTQVEPMSAPSQTPVVSLSSPAQHRPAGVPPFFATGDPTLVRPALSSREVEVLLAWLASESKEDAAARLFISASTVSTHISRIRAKYGAVRRSAPTKAHLLARALQDGYTTLDVW
ncbi:helix-turn-helix transcriptional regulator [Gordonia sp. HY285]|uniref:response regulator transcription factor n=1 Tax=Gordonia liuliyuniae TaxID=2911517 RepID=UPI001F420C06|nr:helix-turn-helix transcriptional regulator [Gordonia liuliyuniae]MCF8609829.1 helix-turn-helix transcriptional regulator [Gordonia liuliyuniae]